jgi:glycosyltransferase involved in cell wall biosynthesis
MAVIAFLDGSFPFTGETLRRAPLGGVQSATAMLSEEFARRGHDVTVRGMVEGPIESHGVRYVPLHEPDASRYDLVIANAAPVLFRHARARQRALWLHGPARYLRKPRHLWPYLRYRPALIFLGAYHAGTWLRFAPRFRPAIIPYGMGAPFTDAPPAAAPPARRAIFYSNPRRGLDWLLAIWAERIRPRAPDAELHLYCGGTHYGDLKDAKLDASLHHARQFTDRGVVMHDPLGKEALVTALRQSRVMLYRGDPGETFCFAAAEAQAMGVPLVTAGIGSLAERVRDNETGFVRSDPDAFADAAVRLLTNDALWTAQHRAAIAARATMPGWSQRAAAWEQHFGL